MVPHLGYHSWNTGLSSIVAGSVIRFSAVDKVSRSVSVGSYSATGDAGLSASSETIYAYLGSDASHPTTFLAGVSSEGSVNLTPAGLVAGVNAVVLTNSTDYAQYAGPRVGQSAMFDYRTLVNSASNWQFSVGGDQGAEVPNTTNFSAVPLPGAAWLFAPIIGLFGATTRQRIGKA